MSLHTKTVFRNSCLKVPVNPSNRLPSAMYERSIKIPHSNPHPTFTKVATDSNNMNNDPLSFREFYKSIPDYRDVNHLSNQEFYLKLQTLRQDKCKLLMQSRNRYSNNSLEREAIDDKISKQSVKQKKSELNYTLQEKELNLASEATNICITPEKYWEYRQVETNSDIDSILSSDFTVKGHVKVPQNCSNPFDNEKKYTCPSPKRDIDISNKLRSKRNGSACSISWVDEPVPTNKYSTDNKYQYRDDTNVHSGNLQKNNLEHSKKSYSVPTSPLKKALPAHFCEPTYMKSRSFKMTEREDENKILNQLRDYSDELNFSLLQGTQQTKPFRAKPVPIESRIPLYDKILQDQEMRRSISKLQSTAELQAQMRPFSFTSGGGGDSPMRREVDGHRLCCSNPQLAMAHLAEDTAVAHHFRAKPIPKNLFSNYIYDKMREDDYFRALSRRIRAEEMLKAASLPPSMAKRERHQKELSDSTKEELYKAIQSEREEKGIKSKSAKKIVREEFQRQETLNAELEGLKRDFAVSGRKFSHSKSKRSGRKHCLKKIYGSTGSDGVSPSSGSSNRTQSAAEIRSINRSNLAAILRIESTKRKLEENVLKQLEEERYQSEIKWRDSVLRKRPAWNTLKYSHSGDLAMRLQTRRDEERLRKEQFLHEMELMYGRVHRQPLMFERTYSPRKRSSAPSEVIIREDGCMTRYESPKPRSALSKRDSMPNVTSPDRSRKVSINETAETIEDGFEDFFYKNSDDDKESKSSDEIPESIEEYQLEKH